MDGVKEKNGQVAMEFVFLVIFAFMIFAIFGVVIREQLISIGNKEEEVILTDISGMVQQEINIAMGVSDGYKRTFFVQDEINGRSYDLSITNDYLSGKVLEYEIDFKVAHVEGNVQKGNNTIRKSSGVVYLN